MCYERSHTEHNKRPGILIQPDSHLKGAIYWTKLKFMIDLWKGKAEFFPPLGEALCLEYVCEGVMVSLHEFVSSALDSGEWSASWACSYIPWERALIAHWMEAWVSPKSGLVCNEDQKSSAPNKKQTLMPWYSSLHLTTVLTHSYPMSKNCVVLNGSVQCVSYYSWEHVRFMPESLLTLYVFSF